jgi:hypothetical protein
MPPTTSLGFKFQTLLQSFFALIFIAHNLKYAFLGFFGPA